MNQQNRAICSILASLALANTGCLENQSDESSNTFGEMESFADESPSVHQNLEDGAMALDLKRHVRHEDGRIRYVIEFRADAANEESRHAPAENRFAMYHDKRVLNFVRAFEKRYGIEAISMTSLVGLTISAYLTEEQVETLESDPNVERITPDALVDFSADALSLWTDSGSTEITPWGKKAVNASLTPSNGTARVYVLDAGVGKHTDLNVIKRVNGMHSWVLETDPNERWKLVGCYPHGTHVAGIIGAKTGSGGTQGVLPNVEIVSVSALDPTQPDAKHLSAECITDKKTEASILAGLDWIKSDILQRGKVGIVNISMNGSKYSSTQSLGIAIESLATPVTGYRGALVVQSAGNDFDDACNHAYGVNKAAINNDGILVVGAINDHAQPVVPLNGLPGFRNGPNAQAEAGSNYGACVELWAPGANVYSSWANDPQSAATESSMNGYLSGTSMAAPHVAGIAAKLLESAASTTTSIQLETMVRAAKYDLESKDKEARNLFMPSANQPTSGPRNTPYAEFAVSAKPFKDPLATIFPNGTANVDVATRETYLSFDSWGAAPNGCDVNYRPTSGGSGTSLSSGTITNYWQGMAMPAGNWSFYSNNCPSAATSIKASTAPVVKWLVDNVDRTGQKIAISLPTTAVVKFTSSNANSCSVTIAKDTTPNTNDAVSTQTLNPGLSGTFSLGSTPAYVKYTATCNGSLWNTTAELTVVTTQPPTSGTYVDSTKPAWSWDLSRNTSGQLALVWYTFAANADPSITTNQKPIWYMAVLNPEPSFGYFDNGVPSSWSALFKGTLDKCVRLNNQTTCTPQGYVTFIPSSTSAGQMQWSLGGITGKTNLSRYVFAGAPTSPNLTGQWYATGSESGWGESFDVQGNKLLANVLIYEQNGQPTWVSSSLATWNGTAYNANLVKELGTNACPGCTGTQSVTSSAVGTIAVSGIAPNVSTAALTTTFTAASGLGAWKKSNLAITRLTK